MPAEAQRAYVEIYLESQSAAGSTLADDACGRRSEGIHRGRDDVRRHSGPNILTWIPLPATPGWFRIDITDLFNKWSNGAVSPTPASF
jgi:hypothetical protein